MQSSSVRSAPRRLRYWKLRPVLPLSVLLPAVLLLCAFCLGLGAAFAQAPERSPFAGEWEFTFSGRDNGSDRFTVEADGHITGVAHSQEFAGRRIDGSVQDNGEMDWEVAGAEFFGKADPSGSAFGSWRNSKFQREGGWSAKRVDRDADSRPKRKKQK